jgi:xylulose-5-phosphate/fructose-6-phosphate phosphoketolase
MLTAVTKPLGPDLLRTIDAYWRAANYLTVGQIYLRDNPLLREPLGTAHIKPRLLGHFRHHRRAQPRLRPPEPRHQRA